ncbi:uncharacterized protein N7484_003104 [Penicillium longicatenatum]|uniref:uncharacterized protein n=1 Tax=Penicillium longicatenatum TaxID=1561947 RepID=UPI002547A9AE|nr:uncharacterized protein N7484_003104 [Penicillium longicatenatum]KAJ5649381.1 hypothetical protein N7484_003104 [Penicillium longicatenatum]
MRVCVAIILASVVLGASSPQTIEISVKDTETSNIANIHLKYPNTSFEDHVFMYGDCDAVDSKDHHHVANVPSGTYPSGDTRLVWVIPDTVHSRRCISAWEQSRLIGRSEPLNLDKIFHARMARRDHIPMSNESGIDAEGPWFKGVELLQNKELGVVDVKKAKSKSIGILGAGISGLMTYFIKFLLHSVGFTNLEVSESTNRVGGRIWTEYFDLPDSKYQYQEFGAMRIPITATFPMGNETLTLNFTYHQMVFQLSEALNKLNKYNESLNIDWIPFIYNSDNALSLIKDNRNPDGSIPTIGDVARNRSIGASTIHTPHLDDLKNKLGKIMLDPAMMKLIASNIFEAHKKFLDVGLDGKGGDDWSKADYIHNVLGFDLNTIDLVNDLLPNAAPFWAHMTDDLFFSSKEWKTIDKGMIRLPNAFKPLIQENLRYHRKIQKIEYLDSKKKVQVSWKNKYTDRQFENATYDYAFVSVPFTVVRKWELPEFSPTLANAISKLGYGSACKVALEFKSRFWEHLDRPIFGSCNTQTDVPGIGSICYPSYNINGTGPAVVLASYNQDDYGKRWVSTPKEEHAQYVLDSFARLHGEIVYEQYTGNFKRVCWLEEEFNAGGSWVDAGVGQHKLYMPSYFNTENNIIFIGEHTAYTHSWIASALESSVRGTVQLLLELGLVDEAKEITETWMGKWVTV